MAGQHLRSQTSSKEDGPVVRTSYDSSLPPHIHEMLTQASAQLKAQTQQWDDVASQLDDRNCLDFKEVPGETIPGQEVPVRRQAREHHQQREERSCPRALGLAGSAHSESLSKSHGHGRIQVPRKSTAFAGPGGPGYSYSHAPKMRLGNQQSDPHWGPQIQINFVDSLALRIPTPTSLVTEMRAKENLRIVLTKVAQEALEVYGQTHGCCVGSKAIDLKCFGSLRNGFALPGAVLDLFMTTNPTSFPKQLETDCPQILQRAFSDAGFDACLMSMAIKTPVLQLREKSGTRIQCRISFSGHLTIYGTELLRCYALCDDRIRLVGMFVKMWAKSRKINLPSHGTMCSYGYVIMVIHYLMNVVHPPLAPNLQLAGCNKAINVDGHDVQFFSNEDELRARAKMNAKFGNPQSVGDLLRGFFAYYGSRGRRAPLGGFNWVNMVVSIRTLGGIVPKAEKKWTTVNFGENGHRLNNLVAVEDPFKHGHNVASTVTHNGLKTIRAEFGRAHTIISRVQEIPGTGWEWRTDDGDIGEDFLAEREFPGANLAKQTVGDNSSSNISGCTQEFESKDFLYNPLINPGTPQKTNERQIHRDDFRKHTSSTVNTMRRLLRPSEHQKASQARCSVSRMDRNGSNSPSYMSSAAHEADSSRLSLLHQQQQPKTPSCHAGVGLDPRQFQGPSVIRDRTPECEKANINIAPNRDLLSALPFHGNGAC